jgi:hypothetical protein
MTTKPPKSILKSSREIANEATAEKFARWFGGTVEEHLAVLNGLTGRVSPKAIHGYFGGKQ